MFVLAPLSVCAPQSSFTQSRALGLHRVLRLRFRFRALDLAFATSARSHIRLFAAANIRDPLPA